MKKDYTDVDVVHFVSKYTLFLGEHKLTKTFSE